jgi:hypothetical protein
MNLKLILGVVGGFFASVIVLLLIGFALMSKMGRGGCPLKTQSQTQSLTTSSSNEDYL